MQDISARKRAEEELRRSNKRFRSLVNLSTDWFWEQDAGFRFTTFEGRGITDHGDVSASAVIGKTPWELAGVVETSVDWERHRARLLRHEPFRDLEYAYRDRKGKIHYISANGEPAFDERGAFAGYHGTTRDVTERKLNEERIQHLATHDSLTGLPNRGMFSQMLNLTLESSRRYGRRFAVLFIDLDGFKAINDSRGHEAGDTLLREVAARLRKVLRASDVVARLGGDEFVALLQEVDGHERMARAARKILSAVLEPVEIAGRACRVTASIGGSMYPDDAADERSLMKNADGAMYRAKQDGKNAFRFHGEGA
jgi:diguanylate cyclase (GGDEF)-like protein/PAS domain S-box-containing protein